MGVLEGPDISEHFIFILVDFEAKAYIEAEKVFGEACDTIGAIFEWLDAADFEVKEVGCIFEGEPVRIFH